MPKNQNVWRVRYVLVGRLLVDTFSTSKEMVKSSDYSLNYLSGKYLGKKCVTIDSDVTTDYMESGALI